MSGKFHKSENEGNTSLCRIKKKERSKSLLWQLVLQKGAFHIATIINVCREIGIKLFMFQIAGVILLSLSLQLLEFVSLFFT